MFLVASVVTGQLEEAIHSGDGRSSLALLKYVQDQAADLDLDSLTRLFDLWEASGAQDRRVARALIDCMRRNAP